MRTLAIGWHSVASKLVLVNQPRVAPFLPRRSGGNSLGDRKFASKLAQRNPNATITGEAASAKSFFTSNLYQPTVSGQQVANIDALLVLMGRRAPYLGRTDLGIVQQMLGLRPQDGLDGKLKDAVFVCIDCEAYEKAHDRITEIGVAVFDTRHMSRSSDDIWMSKLEYAHYRPVENGHLLNRIYVKGREEFFNFGSTKWIRVSDMPNILRHIFQHPTSVGEATELTFPTNNERRNVVLVAHNASSDKAFMHNVGFNLHDVDNLARTIDTQVMAGAIKKQQVGLRRLLLSLGLEPYNLHNGGNDAAYTLQALLRMAIKDIDRPGSVYTDLERFAGKLPKTGRASRPAPHVWAGSVMADGAPPQLGEKQVQSETPPKAPPRPRKERKKALRLIPKTSSYRTLRLKPSSSKNLRLEKQKPLPPFQAPSQIEGGLKDASG